MLGQQLGWMCEHRVPPARTALIKALRSIPALSSPGCEQQAADFGTGYPEVAAGREQSCLCPPLFVCTPSEETLHFIFSLSPNYKTFIFLLVIFIIYHFLYDLSFSSVGVPQQGRHSFLGWELLDYTEI